jgi:hypothetical protein
MSNNYNNNNDDVTLNQGPSKSSKSSRTKELTPLEPGKPYSNTTLHTKALIIVI